MNLHRVKRNGIHRVYNISSCFRLPMALKCIPADEKFNKDIMKQ